MLRTSADLRLPLAAICAQFLPSPPSLSPRRVAAASAARVLSHIIRASCSATADRRQDASLHPHPEQVTDELFSTQEFFDPRDLVQVKYEMLRRVQSEGQTVG